MTPYTTYASSDKDFPKQIQLLVSPPPLPWGSAVGAKERGHQVIIAQTLTAPDTERRRLTSAPTLPSLGHTRARMLVQPRMAPLEFGVFSVKLLQILRHTACGCLRRI